MTSLSLKKFIWNNTIVFILLNSSGALNYIFQIILGRTLTPDQYGSFNSLLALSALITTPFTILHLVFSRFIAMMTENNLQKIASNYLKVNEKNLSIRDIQLRMDFPNDSRNSYGWHQDNAYDEFNLNSKNGVILWIPLVDTNKDNGALVIKKGSQYSSFNCSKRISKGDDYNSEQILVKPKYLKKYRDAHIDVRKNNCLATYSGIFHKSGVNLSSHIRFTLIVRYNNQLSKDFFIVKL